jgi:hypothetical protein
LRKRTIGSASRSPELRRSGGRILSNSPRLDRSGSFETASALNELAGPGPARAGNRSARSVTGDAPVAVTGCA